MTDGGMGVDVAIEAVGIPQTFDMCTSLIRPGASVANVGVYGKSVELKLLAATHDVAGSQAW